MCRISRIRTRGRHCTEENIVILARRVDFSNECIYPAILLPLSFVRPTSHAPLLDFPPVSHIECATPALLRATATNPFPGK